MSDATGHFGIGNPESGIWNLESGIDMECKKERNTGKCSCTYEPCSRKAICCDCLQYHLSCRELPACCFPKDAERTYDRSFEHFARLVAQKRV